ncbi:MAG: thioredoxin domain-containing protein [Candidatus Nanohaloarchaea archaeon]
MAEEHRCDECGRSFDSQRGLKVHKSQAHEGDEKSMDETGNSSGILPRGEKLVLSLNQALALSFFLGLVLGGFGMSLMAGDVGKAGSSPSNSRLVELKNTEYPYKGIPTGIADSSEPMDNLTAKVTGEPYIGNPDAEVTMVAYEDFECPFCNRYHQGAYQDIVKNYISKGKVQYFYKHFPLSNIHPWAVDAAIASECALNQDVKAFWTFQKGFFNNKDLLTNLYKTNQTLFDRSMVRWAEQTGLDVQQFKQCYNNKEELPEVREDFQQGSRKGVGGTPTVFVENQKIVGAQPFMNFQKAIESELAE